MLVTKIKLEKREEVEYEFESPNSDDPLIVKEICIKRVNEMRPDWDIVLITQNYR